MILRYLGVWFMLSFLLGGVVGRGLGFLGLGFI